MPHFTYVNENVYYEEHGQGPALVVLNGIFMSAASWAAFVPAFSKNHRLILTDFLDQGKSGKMGYEYTQELQVGLVAALLEHLCLPSANILGISYGGEVAMAFAARYPEKVSRLILSNTAAYTSHWLLDIGRSWEYAFNSRDGRQFFKTCIPIIYSPGFYERNYGWASAREEMFVKTFTPAIYDAFGRLTRSAETHDQRPYLSRITAPTLIISSELDFVTPPFQQTELAAAIPGASRVIIPDAGHAVMYEKPVEFAAAVLGFVGADDNIRIV